MSGGDIEFIGDLIQKNPSWHRTRLSKEICLCWNWKNENGQLKDMACRTLLLKLQRRGWIQLPPPLTPANNHLRNKRFKELVIENAPIATHLRSLQPVFLQPIQDKEQAALFVSILHQHHYLGYSGIVGENIRYLAWDAQGNPLAALLFGSAAWKTQPRDDFIGWNKQAREKNLFLTTNNQRFLIGPWVRVPHLASHLLSQVAKRISNDWMKKYGHPVYLMETFVDLSRFRGTCYRAANWTLAGHTKGRSRQDRHHRLFVPMKAIYLYPLVKDFRRRLQ